MIFRSPWPDIELPQVSVCDSVLGTAKLLGDKPAIIEGETGRTLTYKQLVEQVERVATGLACAGLRPGQPLALVLPNCLEFVLAWYGILLAGGWVVPIPPLFTSAEMEFQIHDSGARFVITCPEFSAALESRVDHLFVTNAKWNDLLECNAPPADFHPGPNDLAALPYSSGTTGKPKGVVLTHFNLVSNLRQFSGVVPLRAEDVMVNIAPLYHATGLSFLTGILGVGGTMVLMRKFELETWLALNERYRATFLFGPPPVALAVAKSPLWDKFRLDSLQWMLCGAAPLGADLQESFERRTGLVLRQGYGMTESTSATSINPKDPVKRKLGSCGHLFPSCEARVVDIADGRELAAGETGETWLRGPHIMKGYWNQPEATEQAMPGGGWMRTGDIGYFDSDGCIFIVDRLKEFIKYKAYQVAPAELEDILQSHPAVQDAAVIGAPGEAAGEIPIAFVVTKENFVPDATKLMQYVAARVAPYKKIRAVEFVGEIPKSPAGKILRRILKEKVRVRAQGSP